MRLALFFIRRAARRAAYQTLQGRMFERDRPERGRLLRHHVDHILHRARRELDQLLLETDIKSLPTCGSRHNAILALFSIASYHAIMEQGIEPRYAAQLVADVAWKLYTKILAIPKFIARCLYRDPQKRIAFILKCFMTYPFSAPGKPAYEVKAWPEEKRYCTFWTHCPPLQMVRDYIERHGDNGELEAFRMSWCSFDWSLAYAMVDGGFQQKGHYERPRTMSEGDEVCKMFWYARPPTRG